MVSALTRWGGVLLRPRATVAALAPDERRLDGLILGTLYVLGSQLLRLAEGMAAFEATRNLGGLLGVAAALGRAVLPAVLLIFLVESLLPPSRRAIASSLLVPLVLLAASARLLLQFGVVVPGPVYLPEVVATVWAAGIALWIRADPTAAKEAAKEEDP